MQFYKPYCTFIIIFSMMIVCFSTQAQSVKQLESQRKQTLKSLATTSKMLNETKKSQRSSLNKLTIISKNIKERQKLITNINTEIGQLDVKMNELDQQRRLLGNRLQHLKSDYAKLVQEEHINEGTYAKIAFVLSGKNFDQSYRRLRYLQEYSDYRKQQVQQIQKVTAEIVQKNDSISVHKTTKVEVVKQKLSEAQKLATDVKKEKGLLTDLQKKEKKLRQQLKVQQKKANDINRKIERIIAAEIRKAEERQAAEERKRLAAEEKARDSSRSKSKVRTKTTTTKTTTTHTSSKSVSVLTKAESLISGSFERNIGRMPWPAANGFISGHYGVQPHAVLKHVTTNNKGIYIQTPAQSTARAVFEGVVTQCFTIPGSNNAVIIKHGNFRTVYANLTQIYVREGDKVHAKQSIGKIFTDDDNENKTELYFQVWKGKVLQNPERWIAQ